MKGCKLRTIRFQLRSGLSNIAPSRRVAQSTDPTPALALLGLPTRNDVGARCRGSCGALVHRGGPGQPDRSCGGWRGDGLGL